MGEVAHDAPVMTTLPFWIAFGTTVGLLAVTLWSGLCGRRRLHLVTGPVTMVSLGVAIWLTEELLRSYSFPEASLRTHLWFAKSGGLLALPVIVTGVWTWRSEAGRRWHKLAVFVWVVAVLAATGSGLWLFGQGTPKAG